MGTINYHTSDYITLGVNPNTTDAIDCDFLWEEIENILGNVVLDNYKVSIKPGYYEGFSVYIENYLPVCFYSWQEKKEAYEEISFLAKCLLECIDCGLVQCWPGWCTAYASKEYSYKGLFAAVEEMKEDVKKTPVEYD